MDYKDLFKFKFNSKKEYEVDDVLKYNIFKKISPGSCPKTLDSNVIQFGNDDTSCGGGYNTTECERCWAEAFKGYVFLVEKSNKENE